MYGILVSTWSKEWAACYVVWIWNWKPISVLTWSNDCVTFALALSHFAVCKTGVPTHQILAMDYFLCFFFLYRTLLCSRAPGWYHSTLAALAEKFIFVFLLDMSTIFKEYFSLKRIFFLNWKWKIFWRILKYSFFFKRELLKLMNYSADMCQSCQCTTVYNTTRAQEWKDP
jgi:hypothetical protein